MSSVRKSLRAAAEKGCIRTSEGVRPLPTMFSLACSWEGKGDSQRAVFFFKAAFQYWVTSDGEGVHIIRVAEAFLYFLWKWLVNSSVIYWWFWKAVPFWEALMENWFRRLHERNEAASWMKTLNFFAHSRPVWHLECFACSESLKTRLTLLWQESWGGPGSVHWLFSQLRSMLMCSTVELYQFPAVFKEPL